MPQSHLRNRALRRSLLTVVTGVAALALVVPTAAADDAAQQLLVVEGTVEHVVVEPAEGEAGHEDGTLDIATFVEVDGDLYPLPADVPVDPARTGDAVEVAVMADAGMSVEDALAVATADAPPPGATEAPIDAPAAAVEGEAQVVSVTTDDSAGGTAAAGEVLAEAAIGSHTLTVLPVYWSATDGTTKATLTDLANQTAQYWSEQSAGRISITSSVRDWAKIADPGTCDTGKLMSAALAAHGVAAPTNRNQHVLVYFPTMASCNGWAGLASINGSRIWVNGAPIIDVFTHEFGHNLGLGHANTATCTSGGMRVPFALTSCTVREYADTADVMGYAIRGRASGNLNTAMADHLGLATVVRPTTSAPATVDLAPLASTTATRSIAIPVSGGTIYVDFRPAAGRDVRQVNWAGVQVHYRTTDPTIGYPTTYLLDMSAPAGSAFGAAAFPVGTTWSVPGTGLTITVDSVGATARVSVAPGAEGLIPAAGEVQAYVEQVYQDLFNRTPDASGLQSWTAALLAGTPRVAVANAITSSKEYRSRLVSGSYATFLDRSPDSGGLAFWLSVMASGTTIQQMEGGFLSSDEYYAAAGGTDAGWVSQLYQHVLNRTPKESEVAYWTQAISLGTPRWSVAMGFLLSTEHLTTVVDGYYVQLLGRHIDASGRATWVTEIQRGARVEAIIGAIVASDEYFARS